LAIAIVSADEWGYCRFVATLWEPTLTGYATFYSNGGLVTINVQVSGIQINNPNGLHGLHVHQYGDISHINGTNAGTHFNPLGTSHGCPPATWRHLGDTGNWNATSGTISQTKTLDLLILTGNNSIIGRAFIIHAQTDDCGTVGDVGSNTTGNSGNRLAQCVIGIGNNASNDAVNAYTSATRAICVLQSTNQTATTVTGQIFFEQVAGGVKVNAYVNGLTDGSYHGFHIHQYGDMSDMIAAASAGLHFDGYPTALNHNHGIPPTVIRHLGDLGNLFYYNSGQAQYFYGVNDYLVMNGSANNIIGRAVVVHQSTDDCSNPVGNSGKRYAFCVIGIASPNTTFSDFSGLAALTLQNTSACSISATGSYGTSSYGSTGSNSAAGFLIPFATLLAALFVVFLKH